MFRPGAEYEAYVEALTAAKIIPDSTYIWWALRPSLRHPTLELQLTDCCTSVDDAIAIAGLFRALVKHLVEHSNINANLSPLARALTQENRWRAQRYGIGGTYVDIATAEARPFTDVLSATIALVECDFEELALTHNANHLRRILARGTSAHQQLRNYDALRASGMARLPALKKVVRWLLASTESGDFQEKPCLN
jgi:carboxylate-amine ligase